MKTLFLFVDESGNFDFSLKGTKYFTMTCLSTFNPVKERDKLVELRYRLLSDGIDQESFHATEDAQVVRDYVFGVISDLRDDIEVHSVITQKNKVNPTLYKEEYYKKGKKIIRNTGAKLYQTVCKTLLQYVFERSYFKNTDKIVVVLGSMFTKDKQSLILKVLKIYLKEKFKKPFEIYFQQSKADLNCQLADYFCWAIAIKKERGEERPFKIVESKIQSQFEIFKQGNKEYY